MDKVQERKLVLIEDIIGLTRVIGHIRAGRHADAIESCEALTRSLECLLNLEDDGRGDQA